MRYHTVVPPNTGDLGTDEKTAVFGNRWYCGARAKEVALLKICTFTSTKRSAPRYNFSIKYFFLDLRMGGKLGEGGERRGGIRGGG